MTLSFRDKVERIRLDFPMLQQTMHGKPLIYLDSAATAHKPNVVIDAMADFYRSHYATVNRAVYQLAFQATETYHQARQKVKRFLNAYRDEEIIFTRGTTESINLVATSFGKSCLQRGDEILVSAMEHHSNLVPWQMVCEETGASLKIIPMNDRGELLLDAYADLLSPRTRLVAITHISNVLGTRNPIKKMARMAHDVGACVLIDGAQSTPHQPIDLQDLDVDFFVFSGHKLMGPMGIGVLYGKEEWLERLPPYQGGGDMIERVTFSKTTYQRPPLKFEAGTPMVAEVIGLSAAIDYLEGIGMTAIQEWEHHLLERLTQQLEEIPDLTLIGRAADKGAVVSFVLEGIHPLDIGAFLDVRGIAVRTGHHCAQPLLQAFQLTSTVRASFACYNTEEEVDCLVTALHDARRLLRN